MAGQHHGTSHRGFASMDQDKQRAIAAKGGRAAHASGNAHEFSPVEARVAVPQGRRGDQPQPPAHGSDRYAKAGTLATPMHGSSGKR